MREAFEAWYGEPCVRDGDGYLLRETRIAWLAWQAATKVELEAIIGMIDPALDGLIAAIRARTK